MNQTKKQKSLLECASYLLKRLTTHITSKDENYDYICNWGFEKNYIQLVSGGFYYCYSPLPTHQELDRARHFCSSRRWFWTCFRRKACHHPLCAKLWLNLNEARIRIYSMDTSVLGPWAKVLANIPSTMGYLQNLKWRPVLHDVLTQNRMFSVSVNPCVPIVLRPLRI